MGDFSYKSNKDTDWYVALYDIVNQRFEIKRFLSTQIQNFILYTSVNMWENK